MSNFAPAAGCAIKLIEIIAQSEEPLGITAISKISGINKNINDKKLNDYIEQYNVSDEEIRLLYEIYEQ